MQCEQCDDIIAANSVCHCLADGCRAFFCTDSRLYSKHVRQVTRTLHVNGIHNSLMRGVYPLPVIKHCIKYTCNCALADKPMEEKCEIAKATSREQLFDSERTLAAPANFKCLCAFWLGADDLQIQCADLTNYQQPCMLLPCQSLSSANNNDDNNDPTMWVHEALNNNQECVRTRHGSDCGGCCTLWGRQTSAQLLH